MLIPDLASLLEASKSYIMSTVLSLHDALDHQSTGETVTLSTSGSTETDNTLPPALKRFRFLAEKLTTPALAGEAGHQQSGSTSRSAKHDILMGQLNSYVADLKLQSHTSGGFVSGSFYYWQERINVYSLLAPIAQDLVAAPASQAYVERIFSICGMLTCGRRNRMEKSLEIRTFLRMNSHL
jgi:hypothetical protein